MSQGYGSWRRADSPPEATTTLRLDEERSAYRPPAPMYPAIPGRRPTAPPEASARGAGPRLLAVALLASLIGGGLAAAVTVVALGEDRPEPEVAAPAEPPPAQAPDVPATDGRTQVEVVAEAVLPTVVRIDIADAGGVGATPGNGSGVIYRSDGYIITNNHVIADADKLEVVFADGSRADATEVGRDVLSDIAVVRVDRDDLTAIQIGDSSRLRVGQLAVAIGSPFGLEGSVTAGVISAVNRPISVGQGIRLPNVIQTDAPINPGNSGGALVGADGRLVGINSAIFTTGSPANAGVGFAVPVSTAVDIADELIESGSVTYPYLGVVGTNVPPAAASRLGVDEGALIERVEPGTPAADVGLQPGDVVVSFDGQPITTMDELIIAVRQADIGDTVEVVYFRDETQHRADVTLVERPDL